MTHLQTPVRTGQRLQEATYNLLREYSLMPDSEAFPRAIAAAQRAVEIDPNSSRGHRSLAFALFNWSFDVPSVEREFRTAIALDPRNAEAPTGSVPR